MCRKISAARRARLSLEPRQIGNGRAQLADLAEQIEAIAPQNIILGVHLDILKKSI